jgi:hypothetical protein
MQSMSRPLKVDRRKLFRLTGARLSVLEILANFGIATREQIARLHFGDPTTPTNLRQVRQLTDDLEEQGYVRWLPWLKRVYGLTGKGVAEAAKRDMSDPYELWSEKSLENVEHELKRTETHATIEALSEAEGWPLRWRKTDLYRHVDPDDQFTINTTHFVFEEENKKKTFEDLYKKAERHFDYWDTDRAFRDWGFRTPNILWQFPNNERMLNFLDYLTGKCNCTYYRGKIRHTCLRELGKPPITTKTFIFAYDDLIYNHRDENILYTAADYTKRSYSFSDLVA